MYPRKQNSDQFLSPMSSRAVVRRTNRALTRAGQVAVARNLLRYAMRNWRRRKDIQRGIQRAQQRARQARNERVNRNRGINTTRRFYKIKGKASGPTHSTTRMIVRRTPRRQKFLRKLFRTNPLKTMYVHRYGFAWMGASATSKTIWYSCTSLKFNNVNEYMKDRISPSPTTVISTSSSSNNSTTVLGNMPDAYIYIGKCTYQYELFNPTNYNITVYMYDLICKRDTPYDITYSDANNNYSSSPESCMVKSDSVQYDENSSTTLGWKIADPVVNGANTYWNSIGMKPTDYHYFNTFWKVKGLKKIVLAPGETHHHRLVYNPKARITQASLYMPRQDKSPVAKNGIGGLTVATLFGFQGQVAVENDQSTDNSASVGTLPGKIVVNLVRKENIWSGSLSGQRIVQSTNLLDQMDEPKIFTDLIEQPAGAV